MDMEPEQADVHTTLEYRLDAEFADWLPIGVLTIFCGLFLFAIAQPGLPPPGETIGAAAAIVVGIGIAACRCGGVSAAAARSTYCRRRASTSAGRG
jgi:hypothetical protein